VIARTLTKTSLNCGDTLASGCPGGAATEGGTVLAVVKSTTVSVVGDMTDAAATIALFATKLAFA
jgi:hypothetical protein